ncbi:hypothetical protein Ocin01_05887 [Orchesella cincta]|uniref:Uncharacterized protein n=1 Tax=Orchesella cincta TaxID=48709 RepID=A0A1D2N6D0_ORCCI|nr:hypothetical protein Ocin01_05887 [Orchesella cincta]
MNTYKTEPILLVPSLVDEDCKRFCFESCRLYDQVLRNVCIAVQQECDCIRRKIAYRNTQLHPFLSKAPSQESCKKYCKEGSCQKYFKLDSSTFSECVGAITLCSCSSTIVRFHPELTSVKVAGRLVSETTYSTRFLIGAIAILVVCLILATLVGVYLWKNNNGRRIGVLEQRLQPDCNVENGNGQFQTNTHEDIGIGTDQISPSRHTKMFDVSLIELY